MNDEQKAFERWAGMNCYFTELCDSGVDTYADRLTEAAWEGWQAAKNPPQSAEIIPLRDFTCCYGGSPSACCEKCEIAAIQEGK